MIYLLISFQKGTGEIIGVSDTGLDGDHCLFYDSSEAIPFDTTSSTHRFFKHHK